MKILVSGYFKKGNFGDELIFKIFKERFKYPFKYLKTRFNLFKILKECFSNDALIFPGGGIFQQETGFFSFYYYIFLVFIFLIKRKPVYLLNQGFGKIGNFEKLLIKFLFKRVKFISVRDKKSFDFLKRDGIRVCFSSDSSFCLLDKIRKKSRDLTLIIPRGNKDLWIKTIKFFKEKISGEILIIPFQEKRDIRLSNEIKREVPSSKIFLWKDVDEVIELFEKAEFVFASSYHAVLLSILSRTDFIAVYYNEKVKNLLKEFSLLEKLIESEVDLKEERLKKPVADFEISNIIYKMKEREKICFEEFLKCFHI